MHAHLWIPCSGLSVGRVNVYHQTHERREAAAQVCGQGRGADADVLILGASNIFLLTGVLLLGVPPCLLTLLCSFLIPITNCVAHAQDKHIKNAQALLAAIGAASTVGRVILGFVADKLGKVNVLKVRSEPRVHYRDKSLT